jgi:methionine synthase II (cobalamin-independent)
VFATLGGSLPTPPRSSDDPPEADDVDRLVRRAIAEQEAAGLEPITDGGLRHPDPVAAIAGALGGIETRIGAPGLVRRTPEWSRPMLVDGWQFAASCTGRAVKQVLPGPYSLGRRLAPGRLGRAKVTLALAEALNAELRALATAGCPLIEVVEDAAVTIGDDPTERRLFGDAQLRLTAGLEGVHLSLAIRGGSADGAGRETILGAPYASYLFDLCAGPDNWRLVVDVPGDRGIVVGAEDATSGKAEVLELLAFAIGYAASTGGRGHDRVGLATSGDMGGPAGLPWAAAQSKMAGIGRAAALYAGPPGSLAQAMDPRAIDIRSAAVGRHAPDPRDRARRP